MFKSREHFLDEYHKWYIHTINKGIGRNDKCYCGSGLKYKKCCINNYLKDIFESITVFQTWDDYIKRTSKNNNYILTEEDALDYYHQRYSDK
jgi:hypothetical protein